MKMIKNSKMSFALFVLMCIGGGGQNTFATEANAQNASDLSVIPSKNQNALDSNAKQGAIVSSDSTNQKAIPKANHS